MSKKPASIEIFVDEPPPDPPETPESIKARAEAAKASEPEAPIASRTIAIAGVERQLVISDKVPAADDPGALLRQLTGQLASSFGGPSTGEQLAQEAERERHNAHIGAERMIDLEQRRQRREAQGKSRHKGK